MAADKNSLAVLAEANRLKAHREGLSIFKLMLRRGFLMDQGISHN